MGNSGVYVATLRLADIQQLFQKGEISPFSPEYQEYSFTSGIEYLASELYAQPSARAVELRVLLPREQLAPDLEERTREAVRRYCRARVRQIEQERRGLRQRALQGFLMALVGLVIFIALGAELVSSALLALRILGEVLIVIGWVYVWFPVDALVFGVRHYGLDAKIYRKLMAMRLTVEAAGEE